MRIGLGEKWKCPPAGGLGLNRKTILPLAGVVVLLTVIGVVKHLQWRERYDYRAAITTVHFLNEVKRRIAARRHLTNGYPITAQDVAHYTADMPDFALYVGEEGTKGELRWSGRVDRVFILNPVGVPAKVRFPRGLAGHPAGSEIIAPQAGIIYNLYAMELAKEDVAKSHRWEEGHSITLDDLTNCAGFDRRSYEGGAVSYVPNPVGVRAQARIVRAWNGLPAGLEIPSDY